MSVAIKKSVANPHGGGIVELVEEKIDQPETHPGVKCKRCGHEWTPKKASPKKCPGCQNPGWDKEARQVKRGEMQTLLTQRGNTAESRPAALHAEQLAQNATLNTPVERKITAQEYVDNKFKEAFNVPVMLPPDNTRIDTAKSQAMSILERLI
jgi:hypothetical protein